MTDTTFDSLGYFEKLKAAGFSETQARVQVEAMQGIVRTYDEDSRRELATKLDLKEIELRLLKWQLGIGLALAAIMAKGFGWLGF
ncbi:hypothetical protein [uncultured Mailhella sp.]|uniref:hypothetical protein n=1 Tax=uncultured Mailhella sp. TaxID=1981031 RepID=UPI00260A4635|nr:hypothetical protein [uncultured Mailhella sp.]